MHCVSKKFPLLNSLLLCQLLTDFQNFHTPESVRDLLQNVYNITHFTLNMLLHYLGKLKIQIFCGYSVHMEEYANKVHFQKVPTFKIHLLASLLCTPPNATFISKSDPCRWIPCWSPTNTAVTSAVTNFRCHKLIAKVI